MNLAMMAAAKRDGELIAHLAAERAVLCEAKMVSIRRLSPADQTRLLGDEFKVRLVPNAPWLRQSEQAFIDSIGSGPFLWHLGAQLRWQRSLV